MVRMACRICRLSCSGSTCLSEVSSVGEAEHVAEQRHQPRRVVGRHDQLLQEGGELAAHRLRRVALQHAASTAHHRPQRSVGLGSKRRRRRLPNRQRGEPRIVGDARQELADQPALADASLADDAHQLRRPRLCQLQRSRQPGQLAVTPDGRRRNADRFQPAGRARCFERPGQPVHRHRARLAAQRQLAQRLVAECVARQPPGQRADQHLARRRHGLQPLGDVDRIAGDRIALGAAGAEAARHHRPGVDADVQRQRLAGRGMADLGRLADHLQRRRQRPLGVVLMRHGGAEQRQQGVADELVDIAAMRLDARGQRLEQPVLQAPEHLRIQPFAKRGEAAEVGE